MSIEREIHIHGHRRMIGASSLHAQRKSRGPCTRRDVLIFLAGDRCEIVDAWELKRDWTSGGWANLAQC